ncbi:unnamed protein product [Rhizoctonia solani]|uniref:Uncharacterized protein n=1 Tax=Rhizoctonia solani TaxID=456999 RepID=A0A8H2WN95_9AGAM|nr:unnamed protein product [Rhizoctonia solani]
MALATESKNHYGPVLDKYLETYGLQLQKAGSHSNPGSPSREDIRQAILQLSEPEKVTYLTFETILSLENTELCSNLDLLLSDSAKASLPACFRLASAYCQRGSLIFDHAYGFLCVKVIALFVQVGLLSRSGYINRLVELVALRHAQHSIFSAFTTTVYSLMVSLMEDQLDYGPSARHELFGWDKGSASGAETCLPEIGGCTADQIQLLLAQLWNCRAGFLSCGSRGEETLFPGFGGFLCWIWRGVAQKHGLPGSRQNSAPAWTRLVELSIRFTLFCSDRDADLMSFVLLACPEYARNYSIIDRTNSAVDAQDRGRIAIMTPIKIRPSKDLHIRMVDTLFCFACPSVNYKENIFNIFGAKIERLWFELDQIHSPEQFADKDIPFFCQGFLHILSAMQNHDPELFLRLLSSISEDLYEGIGRVLLLPVVPSKTFKTGSSLESLKMLLESTSLYVKDMLLPNCVFWNFSKTSAMNQERNILPRGITPGLQQQSGSKAENLSRALNAPVVILNAIAAKGANKRTGYCRGIPIAPSVRLHLGQRDLSLTQSKSNTTK